MTDVLDRVDAAIERVADDAHPVERADLEVARVAASVKDTPLVKALGFASEIGDQPPMIAISAGVLAWGWWRGDRRMARAGARMLASHLLATAVKAAVKARVDRTRPFVLADEGRYETGTEGIDEKKHNSFPSGHTAGAVAVAQAFAREYPEHALAARAGAAAIALVQIPRCAHYPSDIGAGALVGLASEALVDAVFRRLPATAPRATRGRPS